MLADVLSSRVRRPHVSFSTLREDNRHGPLAKRLLSPFNVPIPRKEQQGPLPTRDSAEELLLIKLGR
ncbi:hypothetical protein GRJ2_001246700 [Grus japonensis]|uniref:Uncharacterized protein n=1 Tax=Grus japonensis TaxID=30415 RepID=A0ABC9WQT4_GRUJA